MEGHIFSIRKYRINLIEKTKKIRRINIYENLYQL